MGINAVFCMGLIAAGRRSPSTCRSLDVPAAADSILPRLNHGGRLIVPAVRQRTHYFGINSAIVDSVD
jgi:hypothetical protein